MFDGGYDEDMMFRTDMMAYHVRRFTGNHPHELLDSGGSHEHSHHDDLQFLRVVLRHRLHVHQDRVAVPRENPFLTHPLTLWQDDH
jgi:hypothetical protein